MGHYVKPLEDFADVQHDLTYSLKGQLRPLVENRLLGVGSPVMIDRSTGVGG